MAILGKFMKYLYIKCFFDHLIALLLLVISSPFLLIIALAIKVESRGPVFFLQERVGQHGVLFNIIKFRTMYIHRPSSSLTKGNDDSRITKMGRLIRKFHLDEITQLINVLKGEMSLVGPRPEVPEYTKTSPKLWREILRYKPGITGLAALKCSKYEYELLGISQDTKSVYIQKILPRKLRYDLFYVRNVSMYLDLYILWLTIRYSIAR